MNILATVHPKSKKPRVERDPAGAFHIYVSEPPVDGKANQAAITALAAYFGTGKSYIRLLRGAKSKRKMFAVGIDG